MSESDKLTIFLSASFPSSARGEKFKPFDPSGITDAVAALTRAVFRSNGQLLFGGHPTITPLILMIAREQQVRQSVVVYQSKWFIEEIIPEVNEINREGIGRVEWTDKLKTLEESLEKMRISMIQSSKNLAAAFFVGGMEGVQDEYRILRELSPQTLCLPVFGPGGAAASLPKPECMNPSVNHLSESRTYPLFALKAMEEIEKIGSARVG